MANRPRAVVRRTLGLLVVGETPAGSADTFTLAHTPAAGSVELFLNGLRLTEGAVAGGYTISGTTITTTEELEADDELRATYRRLEGT